MTWSEKVKMRDGKCVNCGSTAHLQAHHIKPTFLYPEFRNDIDNGVTLCKGCHQRQHGNNFAGYELVAINGIDPDPERRMEEYKKTRKEREQERRAIYSVWATNKDNGGLVFEAAHAAGQQPNMYIAEAVYMRLVSDGFNPDYDLFVPPWKQSESNT